ncbi:M28 family metallopeptidase [Candidatus Solirubrobacter pratensis]|uniref:M28 family metallopeptidase n=1 Tax=Candidatus Solirubrobacter pratensis TaxID=1298857 RepID=UPI0003F8AF53|nr:M28 family metallopeptidase [Candidatus Solirubrobacter pratensis]
MVVLKPGRSDPQEPALAASSTATASLVAPDRGNRFDGARAWAMLEYQVELGPRPAGSSESRRLAAYIRARLPRGRYEKLPGGLRNVVGEIPGKGKAILVGAHYDTKDIPGFVGANDGAGGTAQMLQVAADLRRMKRPAGAPPIRFVAFDGEEATDDADFYGTGLRGSKPYARKHAKQLQAMILLDFVADKDLGIPRDASSDPGLWAKLRAAAQKVGSGDAFPALDQGTVEDDHTPFIRRGVPSIDLIDFVFACWHKTCDDLTAVSEQSLDTSGEAVLELLRELSSTA